VRKKTSPATIIVWARYYQVMDAIAAYKRELKDTYAKNDEDSRQKAKELRKVLEEAVGDLENYQESLTKRGVPHSKLVKKEVKQPSEKGKSTTGKTEQRDSSADRAAFKREQEEDEKDYDEMAEAQELAAEMRAARKELEAVERGETIIPEATEEKEDDKEDL